jgi:predicted AAA+ superfamily ATPase
VIVFDEIQLYPKARQALKYLVQHGKYHYIATGSLISIKKNVKDILIPSEEKRIQMHPMDYEEFCWATQSQSYSLLSKMYDTKKEMGQAAHRKSM